MHQLLHRFCWLFAIIFAFLKCTSNSPLYLILVTEIAELRCHHVWRNSCWMIFKICLQMYFQRSHLSFVLYFVISYHYMNKTELWLVSCIIFTKFSAGIKQNDLIIHNNQENWRKLASLRIIDYPTQHLSNKTIWCLMCWCVSNDNFALLVILADLPTQCYPHSHHLNKTQPLRSTHFEQEQSSLQSMSFSCIHKTNRFSAEW